MSQFDTIDKLIVGRLKANGAPVKLLSIGLPVKAEAARLARLLGQESFRIIDRRLQALRKQGTIVFTKTGWTLS